VSAIANGKTKFLQILILPSRILSYSKIVKGERNSKWKNDVFTDFDIAEPYPILL